MERLLWPYEYHNIAEARAVIFPKYIMMADERDLNESGFLAQKAI